MKKGQKVYGDVFYHIGGVAIKVVSMDYTWTSSA